MSDSQGRNAPGQETPGPDVKAAETPGGSGSSSSGRDGDAVVGETVGGEGDATEPGPDTPPADATGPEPVPGATSDGPAAEGVPAAADLPAAPAGPADPASAPAADAPAEPAAVTASDAPAAPAAPAAPGAVRPAASDVPAAPAAAPAPSGVPELGDRSYRSAPSAVAGVLLLGLLLWLCIDALFKGHGRAPWYALATVVLAGPLLAAFTLWPSVRANQDRLLVRNPFRTITAPWREVESMAAALSVELRAGGRKFQVWAVPVSLRQRKRANRRTMIARSDSALGASRRDPGPGRFPVGGPGLRSRGGRSGFSQGSDETGPATAWADRVVSELRVMADEAADRPGAVGPVTVTWTWWVIAPAVLGAIALIVLLATG